jgi:hypothetical protein
VNSHRVSGHFEGPKGRGPGGNSCRYFGRQTGRKRVHFGAKASSQSRARITGELVHTFEVTKISTETVMVAAGKGRVSQESTENEPHSGSLQLRTTSIVIWEVLFCTLYLEMAPKGNVRRVTGNRDVATRFIESRGNFKIFLQLL